MLGSNLTFSVIYLKLSQKHINLKLNENKTTKTNQSNCSALHCLKKKQTSLKQFPIFLRHTNYSHKMELTTPVI